MNITTKEELKQIYYINREVAMWQKELGRLRCQSLVKSPIITDMPRVCKTADISDYAANLADYEAAINGLLAQVQVQRKKIIKFIQGIDDSLMKQIIFYRHISCMTWNEVADIIGGGNTEMGVRKAYSRFVRDL